MVFLVGVDGDKEELSLVILGNLASGLLGSGEPIRLVAGNKQGRRSHSILLLNCGLPLPEKVVKTAKCQLQEGSQVLKYLGLY